MTLRRQTTAFAVSALALTLLAGPLAAQQRAVPRGTSGGRAAGGPGPSAAVASTEQRAPAPGSPSAAGRAVPRSYPPPLHSSVVVPGYSAGFYPWGYGGYGFGAYWAPYDPWYYGFSIGVGFGYGYPHGAYGYGYPYAYWPYAAAPYAYYGSPYGSVRLKGSPKDAGVFVDGYYAGTIEDFDGTFQRLHVEPGSHVIEIRADGYEPQSVNVRALADQTINYQAALKKF